MQCKLSRTPKACSSTKGNNVKVYGILVSTNIITFAHIKDQFMYPKQITEGKEILKCHTFSYYKSPVI
jgi:hypothetical protein